MERLERTAGRPVQRIGLSATQRPLEEVGRFLVGPKRRCTVIDTGVRKPLDLKIHVPVESMVEPDQGTASPDLDPFAGGEATRKSIWPAIYPEILELVKQHRSTIVFVNNRRGAERLALRLNELAEDEIARAHHGSLAREQRLEVEELLKLVGLEPSHADRFPQQFSGGQRQRIGIARALALEPKLIVLDEPVSALDVSIQAGVINLLDDLKAKLGLSYLFVAHDLAVIQHIADRVAVMYLGNIVEIGEVSEVFRHPTHPYTQALLSAIPIPDPARERTRERILLKGELPSPANPPSGCKFRTRCQKLPTLSEGEQQRCLEDPPELYVIGADHQSACHYNEERQVV
jgi:oligopeptide/dipeptide ABC transporter ATP-binding protein